MSKHLHLILKTEPGGYWAAYCLDFTLYAVADTAQEAQRKLLMLVNEYLDDAVADPAHADQLLNRRAPLGDWLGFFALRAWQSVRRFSDGLTRQALSVAHPLKHA